MDNRELADELALLINGHTGTHAQFTMDIDTANRIIAALRAAPAERIPAVLFDGYAVMEEMTARSRTFTSHESVSAVLDAVVKLMRKVTPAAGAGQGAEAASENGGSNAPRPEQTSARPDAGASDPMGGMHSLLPLVEQVINDSIGFLAEPDAGAAEGLLEKLEKLALKYEVPSGEHGMYAPDVINDFLHDPEVEKLLHVGYASGWADAREAAADWHNEQAKSANVRYQDAAGRGWRAEEQRQFDIERCHRGSISAIRALSPPSAGGGKS